MGFSQRKKFALWGTVAAIALVAAGITIIAYRGQFGDAEIFNPGQTPPPSNTPLRAFERAAVSCDAPRCADIAREILEKFNGTVADAAIAALACMGVVHTQSSGIGGGFMAVHYDYATRKSSVINARETAPGAATPDMFHGDAMAAQKGGLAVAVPGEMKGYWEMYKRFGSFNKSGGPTWAQLLEPTIKICEEGYTVDHHTAQAIAKQKEHIMAESSLSQLFLHPETGKLKTVGDVIKRPVLAKTLRRIAENATHGGDLLYLPDSELAQWLLEDLRNDFNGIITMDDLVNYRVDYPDPIEIPIFGNLTLHAVPPPGSGAIMAFILRLLSTYEFTPESIKNDNSSIQTYQLITEAFKHAYAKRSFFGDEKDPKVADVVKEVVHNLTTSKEFLDDVRQKMLTNSTSNAWGYYGADFFLPEDHGTAHLSIIDHHGNALTVTTTVNLYFGARIRSKRTGIIYNNQMDDFSAPNITNYFGVPPSPNNFIAPGKRPLSSMTPAVFTTEDGTVRLAIGAAGGTKITTAVTQVSMRNLWFGENIKVAVDARRIHHQLFPMEVQYEFGFLQQWVDGLERIGHKTHRFNVGTSVISGVERHRNGTLFANHDFRKDGSTAGF